MATGVMDVSEQLNSLPEMNKAALGALWREHFGAPPPEQTRRDLIVRILAYKIQEQALGGFSAATRRRLRQFASTFEKDPNSPISNTRVIKPGTRDSAMAGKELQGDRGQLRLRV
jgi:Protein of unknown function (DUF2924)